MTLFSRRLACGVVALSAVALAVVSLWTSRSALADAPAESVAKLPANSWQQLPTAVESGYMWAQPIYVPSRGQVLHWGLVMTQGAKPRNDVRAFDASKGDWTSDYPPADKLPPSISIHNEGKGLTYKGVGAMLDEAGTPAPSTIVNGVCYDSKRDQVIYTMKGLMAAYDPKTRKWRDMGAKAVVDGQDYPGGPPAYGLATCYDPINDEIVLFGHWAGSGGPYNNDLRDVTGQVSSHLGTWRYSFADNTWRRVGETFGSEQIKAQRKEVIAQMGKLSDELDALFVERHGRRGTPLDKAIADKAAKLRALEQRLDGELRVEPPARTGAPMVYDPKNKAIVMFGGHAGLVRTDLRSLGRSPTPLGLDDTWIYDCTTRQWRQIAADRHPPKTRLPRLAYDPASGLTLLVTLSSVWAPQKDRVVTLWGLDVAKGQWSKLHEQHWDGQIGVWWTAALDLDDQLLLLTQVDFYNWPQSIKGQQTFALKLDVSQMKPEPAPAHQDEPAIEPQRVPADDQAQLARLAGMEANQWVHLRPKRDSDTRDWGTAACDKVTGWMYYFGGGHSTYQVNDVAIFNPGAGQWSHHVGEQNDWLPPVNWGGVTMGYLGGGNAHHMRNAYVAVDNRMFISIGAESRRWGAESAKRPGPRYVWFYDLDRGGVWRQKKIAEVSLGEGVAGAWGGRHLATPDGRVLGFGGALEPYDGRFFPGETYFASYDIYTNKLSVVKVPAPQPQPVLEYRPFTFLPDKGKAGQVFFFEFRGDKGKIDRQATWVYDIAANRFTDLQAANPPDVQPGTVVYMPDQDAVLAVARDQQWVYSFKHNAWQPLPLKSDGKLAFAAPYAQTVYSAVYKVLINTGVASGGVAVMKPDVSTLKWGQ